MCVCVCVKREREGEREKERERKCAFTRLVIRRQARRVPLRLASPPSMPTPALKVDVRLPGTENSSSHGAVRRHLLDCNEACLSLALSRRPTLSLARTLGLSRALSCFLSKSLYLCSRPVKPAPRAQGSGSFTSGSNPHVGCFTASRTFTSFQPGRRGMAQHNGTCSPCSKADVRLPGKGEFKLPWREDGPPNQRDKKMVLDQ